jgi:class 3 adenylate cyclase
MTATRRLAAILAADVAGYSRLVGADEEGTLERLESLRREILLTGMCLAAEAGERYPAAIPLRLHPWGSRWYGDPRDG